MQFSPPVCCSVELWGQGQQGDTWCPGNATEDRLVSREPGDMSATSVNGRQTLIVTGAKVNNLCQRLVSLSFQSAKGNPKEKMHCRFLNVYLLKYYINQWD